MADKPRILFCHCNYAQVVPEEVKGRVLKSLCESGQAFEAVADLCEMAARRDPALKRLAAGDAPVLMSYSSDGTPMLTSHTVTAKVKGKTVRSRHKRSSELLIERLFVDTGSGRPRVVFRDPLPLDHGTGSWFCYQACRPLFPSGRAAGATGLVLQHYAFDRKLLTKLQRILEGRRIGVLGCQPIFDQIDRHVALGGKIGAEGPVRRRRTKTVTAAVRMYDGTLRIGTVGR